MADWIQFIVEARMLVGSLGENASPAWWRSEATTAAGIRVLERLYPRTALMTSLETTGRAASIIHDTPLARTGHYHLFRLPVTDELAIRDWLRQPGGAKELQRLYAAPREGRLEALEALAADEIPSNARGPVNCGPVGALHRKRTIERICAVYVSGFRAGRPVYPYLEASTE